MWPSSETRYDVRAASAAESLEHGLEKVFSNSNELFEIQVAEIASKGIEEDCLQSDCQLDEHLSTYHVPSTPAARTEDGPVKKEKASFFLLDPAYGWSHLPITKAGAIKLFSALRAFPELYQYVSAFSNKTFPRDEGFAGFDSHTTIGDDGIWTSFESCYLLKYIDRRDGIKQGANPWAIRHALIYQKVDRDDSRTSHLLARLPTAVIKLLGEGLRSSGTESVFVQDWSHLHTTSFSSIKDNLRQFINYLDQEITDLASQ
ncbi:hypothetical protein FIE12Z_3980 [Fusarium flagelliforme]|uniref:CorA-like transporter domain-containing protein n=1 Tax=Fusarium flagelliforme TaxID=2675880 RepID=A0A395MVJ5_9HYPO|nr:hypothetical protein FIE12Z_3980 [Fusarium flagelliforme]